ILEAIENFDDRRAHGEEIGPGWLGKAIVHPEGFSFRNGYRSQAQLAASAKAKARNEQRAMARKELEAAESEREAHAATERREQFLKQMTAYSDAECERLEVAAIRQAHASGNGF